MFLRVTVFMKRAFLTFDMRPYLNTNVCRMCNYRIGSEIQSSNNSINCVHFVNCFGIFVITNVVCVS